MRLNIGLLTMVSSLLFTIQSQACDCDSFKDVQQAAQTENVIVAKVETISNTDGKARIRVEKVLKGQIDNVYLNIHGQDGVNCNGENIPVGKKGVLIFKKENKGYRTLTCATTNIPQTAKNKYQILLGEDEFELTEKELTDVLNFKMHASVKYAECRISVNRSSLPDDEHPEFNFEYETSVTASPTRDGVTILNKTVDLAPYAHKVGELFFHAEVKKLEKTIYDFTVEMKDPFTGLSMNPWNAQLDIRKNLEIENETNYRFTDLNGNPKPDDGQPYLAHEIGTNCGLILGKPLVLVK